jgi:hypothetical protein
VIAVLVVLGLAGFGVTRASLEDDRGELDEREPAPTEAVEAPDEAVEAPPVVAAATDASTETRSEALDVAPPTPSTATPSAQSATTSSGTPSAEPTPAGPGTIVRGRIAYIRCDGVPQRAGPNPCPRGTRVEAAVWAAIDRLPNCGALAGHRGAADVRVVFDAGTVSGLGFRDLDPPVLDRTALAACLEPALRGLRATVPASRMTAAFRFDLR